jgi:hypothetical protein
VYVVLGLSATLGLVAIIGGFLHSRRERFLTHTERMKALELGRELPAHSGSVEEASYARKCFSTALWISLFGFGASAQSGMHGVNIAVASAAGAACVTAIICGTILAFREASTRSRPVSGHWPNHKPLADPDALDVVSRRG